MWERGWTKPRWFAVSVIDGYYRETILSEAQPGTNHFYAIINSNWTNPVVRFRLDGTTVHTEPVRFLSGYAVWGSERQCSLYCKGIAVVCLCGCGLYNCKAESNYAHFWDIRKMRHDFN
jgi:hypothetical protein